MSSGAPSHFVSHLTWDEVDRRLKAGAAAVLPIGAGAKQHGLHLPMDADARQAEWFALKLAERADALVWPALTYGYYPAFRAYAGSISLSEAVFEALVREIIADIRRFRPDAVFVLDTGISTLAPVSRAVASFVGAPAVHHVRVYEGPRFKQVEGEVSRQEGGGHADEVETSIMLAIAPEFVRIEAARAQPRRAGPPRPGPLSIDDPSSPNYAPSGSLGDPTLASREKGERLVQAMLEDIYEAADRTGRRLA